jgi:hypothetical protein
MDQNEIIESLSKIKIIWENISKESSNDANAYDYISVRSVSLKMMELTLKGHIEEIIEKDNESKIKFTRLHKSLSHMVNTLNHKLKADKDKEYIETILENILKIKDDIDTLKMYL